MSGAGGQGEKGPDLFPSQFSLLYLNPCPGTKGLGLGEASLRQRVCVCNMVGLSASLGVG